MVLCKKVFINALHSKGECVMKRIIAMICATSLTVYLIACSETPSGQTSLSDSISEALSEHSSIDNVTPATKNDEIINQDYEVDSTSNASIAECDSLDAILESIKADAQSYTENIKSQYKTITETIKNYDDYKKNYSLITDWYAAINSGSEDFYNKLESYEKAYYKMMLEQCTDSKELDKAIDDIYDEVYSDVLDDIYDDIYSGALDDVYDDFYSGILDDALDEVEYKEWSDTLSKFYEDWSNELSTFYKGWSSQLSQFYTIWTTMSGSRFSDNKDFNALWEKAQKELAEKNAKKEEAPINKTEAASKNQSSSDAVNHASTAEISNNKNNADESSSTTASTKEPSEKAKDATDIDSTSESDTVFNPQDVSDATIESIKTYGDYLAMYRKIVDNYFADYERVIKGTILYNEESFKQMKKEMNKSFDEQEKQYGKMKNSPIIGKDSLVDFLKDYRDSLKNMVDSYEESLKLMG